MVQKDLSVRTRASTQLGGYIHEESIKSTRFDWHVQPVFSIFPKSDFRWPRRQQLVLLQPLKLVFLFLCIAAATRTPRSTKPPTDSAFQFVDASPCMTEEEKTHDKLS